MAIVVEDGTVVAGANSYATEAELTAYADARGITVAGQLDEDLLKAMDYLETQRFIGTKSTQAQPLQWPREGVSIDGFTYEAANLPAELVEAQLVIAMAIDQGYDPLVLTESSPTVKRKMVKAGSVESETEYVDGAEASAVPLSIRRALRKLIRDSGPVRLLRRM